MFSPSAAWIAVACESTLIVRSPSFMALIALCRLASVSLVSDSSFSVSASRLE